MPFDTVTGAEAVKRCPDLACRGHEPRKISLELRVRAWTQRVGHNGPITVSRTERRPIILPEQHKLCEHCGEPNIIDRMQTGADQRLRWPEPAKPQPNAHVDEQIPEEPAQQTLEQRVTALEAR